VGYFVCKLIYARKITIVESVSQVLIEKYNLSKSQQTAVLALLWAGDVANGRKKSVIGRRHCERLDLPMQKAVITKFTGLCSALVGKKVFDNRAKVGREVKVEGRPDFIDEVKEELGDEFVIFSVKK